MYGLHRILERQAEEFLLNDPVMTIDWLLLSTPSTRRFRVFPFSIFRLGASLSTIAEFRIRKSLSKANRRAECWVL